MPSTSDSSADSWDHIDRSISFGQLPTHTTGQLPTTMSAHEGARRRGATAAASSATGSTAVSRGIAPSEDQYGPKDELSTTPSYGDESKQKLGRHGREAEKWAALLPKQQTKKPLVPGQYRSGLLGVVRRTANRRLISQVDFAKDNADLAPLIIYTFLALFTRLWRIGLSDTVVWDEAHFGKFGAYYLNRTVSVQIVLG